MGDGGLARAGRNDQGHQAPRLRTERDASTADHPVLAKSCPAVSPKAKALLQLADKLFHRFDVRELEGPPLALLASSRQPSHGAQALLHEPKQVLIGVHEESP